MDSNVQKSSPGQHNQRGEKHKYRASEPRDKQHHRFSITPTALSETWQTGEGEEGEDGEEGEEGEKHHSYPAGEVFCFGFDFP
ncbi:unnamed protein product [Merluccius merluccius]